MSEQNKHCKTYPEMNGKIVEYLRISDSPIDLYAAQRIVELEEQLEQAQLEVNRLKEAEHVRTYWTREGLIEHLREQNQKLIEAHNQILALTTLKIDGGLDGFFTKQRISRNVLQEVQHGTST
ncbi:MAG TPA: hypothetical protein IAA29_11910 [Candidatus Paenibacillus intestinavium]|nr:hypothetical protein [Candidatus Paenibacillus intestinavium]